MYLKFRVSRETANDFIRFFVNRLAYGVQATRPLPNGSVPYYLARDWLTKAPKQLDADVVRAQLNGDITINLFAINPETQRSKWIAIDADFDGAMQSLIELQRELRHDGIEAALEQSRRGGHLWMFGETPLLAAECRIYIYNVALRIGIPVKCGGLKDGIEIFPRQDRLEEGEYGNALRAPLGVHRKTNLRYWFPAAAPRPEAQLAYLNGLPKLTEHRLKTIIHGMSLPEVLPASRRRFVHSNRIADWTARVPDSRSRPHDAQRQPQLVGSVPILRTGWPRPDWRQPFNPDQGLTLLQVLGRLHKG